VGQAVLLSTTDSKVTALSPEALADHLATIYPQTVANFRQMPAGLVSLRYVAALDERWQQITRGKTITTGTIIENVATVRDLPIVGENRAFDLIYAGGVLGLFSAAVMARKGFSVLVFDQRQVGTSHREWNISDEELQQFVACGLFSQAELEQAVAARYKRGLISFYSENIPEPPAPLGLEHVLDVAIDLGKLLEIVRQKFLAAGGKILDFRAFQKVYVTSSGPVRSVVALVNEQGQTEYYGARLLINAMGALSPLSLALMDGKPFDGVCPTVGSTVRGFTAGTGVRQMQSTVGEVLVSVAHAQQDRQLIWEGFAGRDDEVTVYLFYYDLVQPDRAPTQSLLALFEAYFTLLPTYKEAGPTFAHLKPVYGFIPARHHRSQRGAVAYRGILSIGDATSPQSALTFCGFGSHVRNLSRLTTLLEQSLRYELFEATNLRQIGAHQINTGLMWVFSRFMQPVQSTPNSTDVNRLMNAFCGTLAKLDPALTRRFFQDRLTWLDYTYILLKSAWRYPRVFPCTLQVLGWGGIRDWISDYLKLGEHALACNLYKQLVFPQDARWQARLSKIGPALALKMAAHREEWKACGWL
jgi:lycopene cyclase CruA